MGLLAKAGSNTNSSPNDDFIELEELPSGGETMPLEAEPEKSEFSLDEMGKALCERLKRLQKDANTPYTALILLKAYGAFQFGICLTLKDGVYSCYTSVGLGVKNISIPREKIWPAKNTQVPYFKLDSGINLGINNGQEKLSYWIFPLNSSGEIMILGAAESGNDQSGEANSVFNPESISAIISDTWEKFILETKESIPLPAAEEAPEVINEIEEIGEIEEIEEIEDSDSGEFEPGNADVLKEKIAEYNRIHADFNCILLEKPDSAGKEDTSGFCKKIAGMLSMTGTVLSLSTGHPLILLPKHLDRELIAHRLSKTLNSKLLASFEASSPENVFGRINPLL